MQFSPAHRVSSRVEFPRERCVRGAAPEAGPTAKKPAASVPRISENIEDEGGIGWGIQQMLPAGATSAADCPLPSRLWRWRGVARRPKTPALRSADGAPGDR